MALERIQYQRTACNFSFSWNLVATAQQNGIPIMKRGTGGCLRKTKAAAIETTTRKRIVRRCDRVASSCFCSVSHVESKFASTTSSKSMRIRSTKTGGTFVLTPMHCSLPTANFQQALNRKILAEEKDKYSMACSRSLPLQFQDLFRNSHGEKEKKVLYSVTLTIEKGDFFQGEYFRRYTVAIVITSDANIMCVCISTG